MEKEEKSLDMTYSNKRHVRQSVTPIPQYYVSAMWRGVKQVYQCVQCKAFRDTPQEIEQHVLLHYQPAERDGILEKMKRSN